MEIGSIGGILIPISGNPEISLFLFQKAGIEGGHIVTCNYQAPGDAPGECKKNESGN